jgi:hypothetical protein
MIDDPLAMKLSVKQVSPLGFTLSKLDKAKIYHLPRNFKLKIKFLLRKDKREIA